MRSLWWYADIMRPKILHMFTTCFAQLFGCDFTSLWKTANQKRCHALLRAGKFAEVFEAYQYMADMTDETTKATFIDWSIGKFLVMLAIVQYSQYLTQVSCKN